MARQTRLAFAPKSPSVDASASEKRKRSIGEVDRSESSDSPQTKRKKAKPTKAAPKKPKKNPEQAYQKTIAEVDKKIKLLNAEAKKQDPNYLSVTSDEYSEAMVQFLPEAIRLSEMDEKGVRCAFNLLLHLAWNAYGDINASFKMSGYGEHERTYPLMDDQMIKIIELLATIKDPPTALRRETITGTEWINNAIGELTESRDYIKKYGHDGFFTKSIARLEELRVQLTANR
jgi:hypothetical protein